MFHERVGITWLREGKFAEAARELDRAVGSEHSTTAWAWLGRTRDLAGDRAGAKRAYQRALELDPGSEMARRGLETPGAP